MSFRNLPREHDARHERVHTQRLPQQDGGHFIILLRAKELQQQEPQLQLTFRSPPRHPSALRRERFYMLAPAHHVQELLMGA